MYKASRKGSGEMFAVKVMRKRRETAVMTGEQCRELSLMKTLTDKHPNLMPLLGWRETTFACPERVYIYIYTHIQRDIT